MNLQNILDFFNNPRTLLIIIFVFFLGFFLSEGLTFGFGNNFLSFGPTQETNGKPTMFIGIALDAWYKVGIAYVIIFLSSIIQSYYKWVFNNNIASFIINPSVSRVPYNKLWTYSAMLLNPLIQMILYVITFFATATFQIQYILPQLIANWIMGIPFTLMWLNKKKFVN